MKSKVTMIISTPNQFIENLAKKYGLGCFVNTREAGIVQDWNFGYSKATTDYITIAHQVYV